MVNIIKLELYKYIAIRLLRLTDNALICSTLYWEIDGNIVENFLWLKLFVTRTRKNFIKINRTLLNTPIITDRKITNRYLYKLTWEMGMWQSPHEPHAKLYHISKCPVLRLNILISNVPLIVPTFSFIVCFLGKAFDITYVRILFYSPRPESFSIYKRSCEECPWIPYQFYRYDGF